MTTPHDAKTAALMPALTQALMPALSAAWVPTVVLAVLAFLPAVLSPYALGLAGKIMVYALFALSLELLVGMTGLVSLGHAAFLGIGAYVAVLASPEGQPASLLALAGLAMAGAAGYALFVGAFSLRTRGVYFIMVTLAFAQMAYFVFHDTQLAGGSDGVYLYVRPQLTAFGTVLADLEQPQALYGVILAALGATYALLALVRRSPFGHALAGIRANEARMRSLGYPTYAYQLAAFVVAGALAGLAGCLLAVKDGVVNPELLSWHESGAVLLMLILGGLGHLRGAVLGAAAFTLLKELLSHEGLVGPLAAHWQLSLGLCIIAFVALLPRGLIGLVAREDAR